jgi:hypothetical protein
MTAAGTAAAAVRVLLCMPEVGRCIQEAAGCWSGRHKWTASSCQAGLQLQWRLQLVWLRLQATRCMSDTGHASSGKPEKLTCEAPAVDALLIALHACLQLLLLLDPHAVAAASAGLLQSQPTASCLLNMRH